MLPVPWEANMAVNESKKVSVMQRPSGTFVLSSFLPSSQISPSEKDGEGSVGGGRRTFSFFFFSPSMLFVICTIVRLFGELRKKKKKEERTHQIKGLKCDRHTIRSRQQMKLSRRGMRGGEAKAACQSLLFLTQSGGGLCSSLQLCSSVTSGSSTHPFFFFFSHFFLLCVALNVLLLF